jgi:hypothetical protein
MSGSGAIDSDVPSPFSAATVARTHSASAAASSPPSKTAPRRSANLGSKISYLTRHLRVRTALEHESTQRIGAVGVKPGRDQHELRLELERGRDDHVLEHGQPHVIG